MSNKPINQMTKEELYKAMTPKQRRFVDEYLIDLNASRAAKAAGYSEKTAYGIGQENMKKPLISRYIALSAEDEHGAAIMSREEVLRRLTQAARREQKEHIVVTTQKERSEYKPDETGKMRKQTVKEEVPEVVEIPTKNVDSNKALELLGKHYRLFTDKVDVTGAVPVILCGDDEIED